MKFRAGPIFLLICLCSFGNLPAQDGACGSSDSPSSVDCDGRCDPGDASSGPDCDGRCDPGDDPRGPDCNGRCDPGDDLGGPDCNGGCDPGDASAGSDCDGRCDPSDTPGSPDCNGVCDPFDLPGSPDCNGICDPSDLPGSPDCNGVCDPSDLPGSPDCNGVCDPSDVSGSPDCNGRCDLSDASGSPDCNGRCEFFDASGSPDCNGRCDPSDAPGSLDCNGRCDLFDASGSPDCNGFCNVFDDPGSPDCTTLPVELTNFSLSSNGEGVILIWTTASESENEKFEIERGTDGRVFEVIGERKGGGNSTTNRHYSFVDKNSDAGINYYRLRQIDFGGASRYSPVISYNDQHKAVSIGEFYPVPSNSGLVSIDYQTTDSEQVNLALHELGGRLLLTISLQVSPGKNALKYDFSNLRRGMYLARISGRNNSAYRKLIIE